MLTVNLITAFRVSLFQQFLRGSSHAFLERVVDVALEMKAFALFSLLFGIGLGIQFERLQPTGRVSYFLTRRLLALLAFGLVHLLFIWNGDILTEYALAGFVVLPFLRLPAASLFKASVAFFGIFLAVPFFPTLFPFPDTAGLARHVAAATEAYANGSYAEIWHFSLKELRLILPLHINVFARTVALMLLGAGIWKSELLRPASGNERRIAIFGVLAAVAGFSLAVMNRPGIVAERMSPVILALGYGALIYSLASLPGTQLALRPLAALGRMAFTNYIMQSVVFSFVFFGFGAGLFGKMGAGQALLVGVAVYIAQAVLSTVWLRYFRQGPLEWLWRVLMYGTRNI